MARRRHSRFDRRDEGPPHADEAGASESEGDAAELAHARLRAGVDQAESVEDAITGAQRWLRDPDPALCEAAYLALREIGPPAVPALMMALRSGHTEAVAALAGIGTAAVPALAAAALDNDERGARRAAAVLEVMPPECLAAGLAELEQLLTGNDHRLRSNAARALSWLGRPELTRDLGPPVPMVAPRSIDSEIELLRDARSSLCEDAVNRLGRAGPDVRAAVPALIDLLFDERLSEAASVALGLIGGPEVAAVVPKLERALGEGATLSRVRTALALWHIARHPGSEPVLLAALKDPNPDARREAVTALATLGLDSAIPAALEALRDLDDWVRETAAHALYGSNDPAVVRALIGALSDPHCLTPCHEGLVEIGAGVVPAVVEAIHEADFRHDDALAVELLRVLRDIGYDALAASSRQAGRENVVGLVDWICSQGADELRSLFRCDAVRNDRVLGWNLLAGLEECVHSRRLRSAGEVAAVEALIAALRHPDGGVRVRAAEALGLFSFAKHSDALRAALRLALNDPDVAVRKAAAETLWGICS